MIVFEIPQSALFLLFDSNSLEQGMAREAPGGARLELGRMPMEKRSVDTRHAYFGRELRGWWDDASKRNLNSWQTYGLDEGYASFDEAFQRYQLQREARAKSGFVHSFSPEPDYYSGNLKVTYQH